MIPEAAAWGLAILAFWTFFGGWVWRKKGDAK